MAAMPGRTERGGEGNTKKKVTTQEHTHIPDITIQTHKGRGRHEGEETQHEAAHYTTQAAASTHTHIESPHKRVCQ